MSNTETFEDMIKQKVWDSMMKESSNFSLDIILPLLLSKENQMVEGYNTEEIYDPYFSTLCLLFAINQAKGWTKEELIKILIDIDNPEDEDYYNIEEGTE